MRKAMKWWREIPVFSDGDASELLLNTISKLDSIEERHNFHAVGPTRFFTNNRSSARIHDSIKTIPCRKRRSSTRPVQSTAKQARGASGFKKCLYLAKTQQGIKKGNSNKQSNQTTCPHTSTSKPRSTSMTRSHCLARTPDSTSLKNLMSALSRQISEESQTLSTSGEEATLSQRCSTLRTWQGKLKDSPCTRWTWSENWWRPRKIAMRVSESATSQTEREMGRTIT